MPVDFHRDPRVGVPQDALHGGGVRAGHHQQARGRVPQVVEPDAAHAGLRPEQVLVHGAAPDAGVIGALAVPAALVATDMVIVLNDAGAPEGTAQDVLEPHVGAHALPVVVWEDQIGGRAFDGGLQVGHELVGDGHRLGRAALGRVAPVRPTHRDEARAEIDVGLVQRQELAASQR